MSKLNLILSSVLFLIIMGAGLLIWRTSVLFTDLATILADLGAGSDSELVINTTSQEEAISLNESHQITENSSVNASFGHYETIEETISRLKRDVYVTGTLTGVPGQEQAFFQIEGMPDRSFNINTQLMDGFIITEITDRHVVLKNQIGDEMFTLDVQSNRNNNAAETITDVFTAKALKIKEHSDTEIPVRNGEQRNDPGQFGMDTMNGLNNPSATAGIIEGVLKPALPSHQDASFQVNRQY